MFASALPVVLAAAEEESSGIEDLLFNTSGDSTEAADSLAGAADEPPEQAPEEQVAEEQEPELNFRPFTGLLNTGDVGTYLVDA